MAHMPYPSIEVKCGKCGDIISKMINLKSLKDILRSSKGKCNSCGSELNATDFRISMEKT